MATITCPTCLHTTTAPTTNMATVAHARHSCQKQQQRRPNPARPALPRINAPGEWVQDAACAQVGGDTWYPEKGDSTTDAKKICLTCPVRVECLDYAITNRERYGVWGGKSERERRRIKNGQATGDTASPTTATAMTSTPDTKQCRTCRQTLPLTAFGRDTSRPDGHNYVCRACKAADARTTYQQRGRAA